MNASRKTVSVILACVVTIYVAVMVVTGCGKRAQDRTKITLVLNWLPNGSHAPYYVAKEKGYYGEEGIDAEILEGSGSGNAVKVVGSGAQTFGVASGESVVKGRSVGIPVVAIAVFHQKSPVCLFSLKKTGITKPEDLVGKKMGVKFGSSTHPMYKAMLKKFGIDESKIHEVSISKGVEPLLAGQVDAMNGHVDNEPVQVSARGYAVNVIMYNSLDIRTYGISLITSDKVMTEQPKMVEMFLHATLKGWQYTIAHPDEASDAVLRANPSLKADIVKEQTRRSFSLLVSEDAIEHGLGWQTSTGWEETVTNLMEMSQIERSFPIEDAYTNRFLEKVLKVNISAIPGEAE